MLCVCGMTCGAGWLLVGTFVYVSETVTDMFVCSGFISDCYSVSDASCGPVSPGTSSANPERPMCVSFETASGLLLGYVGSDCVADSVTNMSVIGKPHVSPLTSPGVGPVSTSDCVVM